jgi:hypothetical protein
MGLRAKLHPPYRGISGSQRPGPTEKSSIGGTLKLACTQTEELRPTEATPKENQTADTHPGAPIVQCTRTLLLQQMLDQIVPASTARWAPAATTATAVPALLALLGLLTACA